MFESSDQRRNESGSVLIVALVTAVILGISVTSCLLLMQQHSRMVFRAQAWNQALILAEAGVEEALAQLNRSFGTNSARGGINDWSGPAAGPASLSSPRGLQGGTYTAKISDDVLPVVTATGRVQIGNGPEFIERSVRVRMVTRPAFQGALVARRDINFKGYSIAVDSYDSGDPNHCTALGLYDHAKRKARGDVASTGGFIDVGNADVKGKLYTSPINAGQYSVGPNGTVGSLSWNGPGIQNGWYFNDFNMDFTSVAEPYNTGLAPSGTSSNKWELLDGYRYMVNGIFSAERTETMYVRGHASLYVTGSLIMRGRISIAPGASLKLYVAGVSARLNEVNTTGNASSFQYYGLPTNKGITWGGNQTYVGSVYAPEATFKLGGGGSDDFDYQGACVVGAMVMNGHFKFHFDENMRRTTMSGFAVSRWEEL